MSPPLPRKVALLGSGALKIGEAGEFDYAGSQCLKALAEENIETIVINPNIATIQTDPIKKGKVYFVPVTPDFVEPVMEREGVDAILLSFGGQSALNCGVGLEQRGVLRRLHTRVLGTPLKGIRGTEDRALFLELMRKASVPVLESHAVYSLEEARSRARGMGYPLIARVAYTLGGKGGGIVRGSEDLERVVSKGLNISPTHQVLLERYVGSFKQIEFEVMRDRLGNALTVCNMENVLSMRVHTGDNIVVAPSQTLTDTEVQTLRSAALRAAEVVEIVGECNIQFALDPASGDYFAIEINARLSRSSALASKATGYPIAYVAAKLTLGYTLPELKNRVTGKTTAFFEPALDYVVVKYPRWDLEKFARVERRLGPTMKSVGEAMGVGGNFQEALMKAFRMVNPYSDLVPNEVTGSREDLLRELRSPTPDILPTVVQALRAGMSVEEIARETWIDPWFVHELGAVVATYTALGPPGWKGLSPELLLRAKRAGLSDRAIGRALRKGENEVRQRRLSLGVEPRVRVIDTLAGEWPSLTNYLYLTYWGETDEVPPMPEGSVLVLGAGPYRIGSSVEFDWSTMNLVEGLKKEGVGSVAVLNSNPETVSTDFDRSDRLYFEEITLERVLDVAGKEHLRGVVTSAGGQLAQNLAIPLTRHGVPILGTSSHSIELAENRSKFSRVIEEAGIPQPKWKTFTTLADAEAFADEVGYPVLVRPSFVLSGRAMRVAYGKRNLEEFLREAAEISPEHPVVITKFIEGATELDLDAVSDGKDVLVVAVLEHVEMAGVHSGDAMMVLPPRNTPRPILDRMGGIARTLGRRLRIHGPFNMQFLVQGGEVSVIELNLRASRSLPFATKATGWPVPMEAARTLLGRRLTRHGLLEPPFGRWGVKAPQFSFHQVDGADPLLGVEMQSTGEVACFGPTFADAMVKAMVATGIRFVPEGGGAFLSVGGPELKAKILPAAHAISRLGFRLYATEDTAAYLRANGLPSVQVLFKLMEPERVPNVRGSLENGAIDLVVNVPASYTQEKLERMLQDEYELRRRAIELSIPLFTSVETFSAYVEGLLWIQHHPLTAEGIGEAPITASLKRSSRVALSASSERARSTSPTRRGTPSRGGSKGKP